MGLARFEAGEGVATSLHLYAAEEDDWNVPAVRARCGAQPVVLVEFAWRERGLIVSDAARDEIRGVADLGGRRVAPRPAAAGSQHLLEHALASVGMAAEDLELTDAARSERDAAEAVLDGSAEAAFGLRSLADQYRLGFVPVIRERFDLLIERRAWFEEPLRTLVEFCRGQRFADRAAGMPGYAADGLGRVHFNGP